MTPDTILFFILAVIAIAAAFAMVFSRNPVHAALFMVANFAAVALIYLTLQASFLAAVQILVYAGAIMVLFLFVVMLFGPSQAPLWEQLPLHRPLALLFSIILMVGLIGAVNVPALTGQPGTVTAQALAEEGNPRLLGEALYENYALPFEATSVLLLIAMIGVIVLAKRDKNESISSAADGAMVATGGNPANAIVEPTSAAD